MTAFALVRKEPSEAMLIAGVMANQKRMVADVFAAMLSASTPPTDAELDELCSAYSATMPGRNGMPASWWAIESNGQWLMPFNDGERERDNDRTRMRAFLSALQGDKP